MSKVLTFSYQTFTAIGVGYIRIF